MAVDDGRKRAERSGRALADELWYAAISHSGRLAAS